VADFFENLFFFTALTIVVNIPPMRPLYDLEQIKTLVLSDKFELANHRARSKVRSLGWKIDKVKSFIGCLQPKNFHRNYNDMSVYDGQGIVDVDAYKLCFDEDACCVGQDGVDGWFFTKLAVITYTEDDRVAVVSFHLDGAP
jgi:hypothetical protein